MEADRAVQGLHPHGDILPLAADLSLSARFYPSLVRATTFHRHQPSKLLVLPRLMLLQVTQSSKPQQSVFLLHKRKTNSPMHFPVTQTYTDKSHYSDTGVLGTF
jgi:hypothetical protein